MNRLAPIVISALVSSLAALGIALALIERQRSHRALDITNPPQQPLFECLLQ